MNILAKLDLLIVQMKIFWHDAKANCEQIETRLADKITPGMIVILPEMFNSGFSMQPDKVAESMRGDTLSWMQKMARQHQCVMLGSLAIREGKNCYNRMIWMPAEGEMVYYDKKHLFRLAGEHERYAEGEQRVIVNYQGWRILLQVCYDLRFPVWCRQQQMDYDAMILVANWPDTRAQAWNALIRARAIENQCYVAAVNRVGADARDLVYAGDSQVVDFLGDFLCHLEDKERVKRVSLDYSALQKSRNELPFYQDADKFELI
ncbi:MAG TPA: amidohydrolase [Aeromonadales bacterium]|nr:amidohydrolase [Aeromonadales bacterium]